MNIPSYCISGHLLSMVNSDTVLYSTLLTGEELLTYLAISQRHDRIHGAINKAHCGIIKSLTDDLNCILFMPAHACIIYFSLVQKTSTAFSYAKRGF